MGNDNRCSRALVKDTKKGNANRCSRALVKDTKKENYTVTIALKTV